MDLRDLLMTDRANQYVTGLQSADPGDSTLEAILMREGEGGQDLDLRDAEHYFFAKHLVDKLGPVLGRAVGLGAIPAYSGAKAIAQNVPGMAKPLDWLSGMPLSKSTPPDFQELGAGLAGLLSTSPGVPAERSGAVAEPPRPPKLSGGTPLEDYPSLGESDLEWGDFFMPHLYPTRPDMPRITPRPPSPTSRI